MHNQYRNGVLTGIISGERTAIINTAYTDNNLAYTPIVHGHIIGYGMTMHEADDMMWRALGRNDRAMTNRARRTGHTRAERRAAHQRQRFATGRDRVRRCCRCGARGRMPDPICNACIIITDRETGDFG